MYSDNKTQRKISLMQHQVQPFSASKYSSSFQEANKSYWGPGFPPDIFNSLERLTMHTIHASGCRDNENTSCTVIIISTTNYTQDILLLVQCHLLSQEENQWLSWAHELCRPLPCWNNSIFYLQKCHQVSCKNSLTQFFLNTKHILKSKFILSLATTEWLRNVLFSIPTFVWSAALTRHEGKQNQNMELQWQPQHPLKYSWVGKLACKFVSPPHLCKPAQNVCTCTKINKKVFLKHRMH